MASPRRRPAEVRIPTTEQEFRERAERAFDSSINSIIRSQFSQRPPAGEIQLLSRVAENMGARELDDQVMRRFREEWNRAHPNGPASVIDRYYSVVGSTSWLLTPTGSVGFNATALANDVRTYFSGARTAVTQAISELARPNERYRHISLAFARIDPDLMVNLQQQLSTHFQSGQNQLPVAATYARVSTDLPAEIQRSIGLSVPLILFAKRA